MFGSFNTGFNAGGGGFAAQAAAPAPVETEEDKKYRATIKELRELYLAYAAKVPRLEAVKGAENKKCHFKAVTLTDKGSTDQPRKPAHIKDSELSKHEQIWKAAETKLIERGMVDTLKPRVIFGVQGLLQRVKWHQKKINDRQGYKDFMKEANASQGRRQDHSHQSEERLERIRQKHVRLMDELLDIMEKVELLQHLNKDLTDDERELHGRVESLSVDLRRSNAVLSDLSAANAQSGRQVAQLQNMDQTGDQVKIDLALRGQRQALEKMVAHHKKDLRDVKIMMDHWGL